MSAFHGKFHFWALLTVATDMTESVQERSRSLLIPNFVEPTKLKSPPPVNDEQYRSLLGQRALKVGEMSAKKKETAEAYAFSS